jgi:hypothetical protein
MITREFQVVLTPKVDDPFSFDNKLIVSKVDLIADSSTD